VADMIDPKAERNRMDMIVSAFVVPDRTEQKGGCIPVGSKGVRKGRAVYFEN